MIFHNAEIVMSSLVVETNDDVSRLSTSVNGKKETERFSSLDD